jgi:hypothetical protein
VALGTPTQQAVVGPTTQAAPVSASFTPPANSLIVVAAAITGTASATGAISVSSSHTGIGAWTSTSAHTSTGTTSSGVLAWSLTGASPSAGTVTVTFSAGGVDNRFCVYTITGVDTTTPVVGTVSNNNFTTATPSLTVTVSPTVDDMLVGTFNNRNVFTAMTAGASFTATFTAQNAATPSAGIILEHRTATTSTTVNCGNSGTIRHTGIAFVVKNAAAAGPVSATLTATTPAVTGAVTATQKQTASLTGSTPAVTGALTAQQRQVASLAGTTPAVTGVLNATLITSNNATLTASTPAVTGAITATQKQSATLAGTTPAVTGALSGTQKRVASGTATAGGQPCCNRCTCHIQPDRTATAGGGADWHHPGSDRRARR